MNKQKRSARSKAGGSSVQRMVRRPSKWVARMKIECINGVQQIPVCEFAPLPLGAKDRANYQRIQAALRDGLRVYRLKGKFALYAGGRFQL